MDLRGFLATHLSAAWRCAAPLLLLALAACSALHPGTTANRPDGEGYAGTGAVVVRITLPGESAHWYANPFAARPERAAIELRYMGIDGAGRALFQRRDTDVLAGTGSAPAPAPVAPAPAGPDTRQIVVDLRTTRQIHLQGKIVEILEATASGVVFRLY